MLPPSSSDEESSSDDENAGTAASTADAAVTLPEPVDPAAAPVNATAAESASQHEPDTEAVTVSEAAAADAGSTSAVSVHGNSGDAVMSLSRDMFEKWVVSSNAAGDSVVHEDDYATQ